VDGSGAPSFEESVLRQGLVEPGQLDECRRLRDNVVAQGLDCTLEEVLLKRGLLTRAQVAAVHAAIGRGNRTAIEGYEILNRLGAGGQGAVYKARQTSMDRLVAIKILSPKYAKEKDGVQRFVREARAIARLNHPNVVAGIDAGHSNGNYYYAMEYVEGEGLDRRITREGRLPWREAAAVLRQVASALDHAHRNDLVHRDIKPGNILLARDGAAKLMDLGMARFAGQDALTLTRTGCVVGTPFYMAPEQARGEEKVDIRADLYSLGITLYEMLAGKPPYTGTDPLVVLNRHLKETVRFAFPDVPPELLAIGHRLTERDRARRYASPAELLEDLDALDAERPLSHARSAVRPRSSRVATIRGKAASSRAPLAIGIGAGVVALAVGIGLAGSGAPPPAPRPAVVQAPSPPPPVPEKPAPPEAERRVLTELANAREYERANPDDLEEIAARYEALVPRTEGSVEGDKAKARAHEAAAALAEAIGKRKAAAGAEAAGHVAARRYGAALESLDRGARAYKSPAWTEWHDAERRRVEAALEAEARRLREASLAAEGRGDFEAAAGPMKDLQSLGVPALAAEAARKIKDLEAARSAADAALARKAAAERATLGAFLDQADRWAAGREYARIDAAAPALETEPSRSDLGRFLESCRGARDVLDAGLARLASLKDRSIRFRLKSGAAVSGRLEAVVEEPLQFLVAGKAHEPASISAASLAELYREARGTAAKPAHVALFAVFEGDPALADETLRRTPVELLPRHRDLLRKASDDAARRAQAEKEAAAQARKEAPAPAKRPDAAPREVVLYASELPTSALYSFEVFDDPTSPGGRWVGVTNDGEIKDPPPANDDHVILKAQVQAGVPYRCWIRMKAGKPKGRSQANLVWLQFTNAVDKSGRDLFPIGTGQYHPVRGPAREGWVWVGRDLADPGSVEPLLTFKTSGEITIRVSAGHEGVGFDQLVLSPRLHLEKPPAEAVVPQPRP